MPDFNFAKGNSKRDPNSPSVPPGHGAPRSASADGGRGTSGPPPAGNAPREQSQRPSVLDKYPERDLSHLTGNPATPTPPPASSDTSSWDEGMTSSATPRAQTPAGTDPSPAGFSAGTDPDGSDAALGETSGTGLAQDGGDGNDGTTGSGKPPSRIGAPLIAMLAIVGMLLVVAFIWFVNPWPPLRDALAGFFSSGGATPPPAAPMMSADAEDGFEAPVPSMRSWDYFVQVSSWKELSKADLDAERYRAQGFDVIVESEFIPAKGGTWYRVRLGPFGSGEAARELIAANANILPKGLYVDSVRLAEDAAMPASQPAGTPGSVDHSQSKESRGTSASRTGRQESAASRLPGRDFEVIDEPMSGWAVKVSSLKDVSIARTEARKLLQQGYPSFITRKNLGGSTWYRVLVGPFTSKDDANRYQQLLNVTYGNDAYTVDLAAE